MFNLGNLISQIQSSNNPLNMVMSILPGNQKDTFNKIANTQSDEQKAQILADLCNKNGITKQQLINAYKNIKK